MEEKWENIVGFEGLYQVSNLGRIKSLQRYKKGKSGKLVLIQERYLKPSKNKGYSFVYLNKENKQYFYFVHRLVATAFIPNANNYPQINHINENKEDNRADNLEWCTPKYNSNYGTRLDRRSQSMSKSIISTNIFTGEKEFYKSIQIAAKTLKTNSSVICRALRGKRKTAKNRTWEYVNGMTKDK